MVERQKPQVTTPVSSSSPLGNASAKEQAVKNSNDATGKKVKIKRSFREIFHRRGTTKQPEKPLTVIEPVPAFMTGTRSSLAKRIKESASLPKLHLPKMSEVKSEIDEGSEPATKIDHVSATDTPTIAANRQAALSSLQAMSSMPTMPSMSSMLSMPSMPTQEAAPVTRYDTNTVINKIISHVNAMPSSSPDRLRVLEIAEVCTTLHFRSIMLNQLVLTVQIKQALVHTIQCHGQAKISAEKAKEHARNAELKVERASLELLRLQNLCAPDFDEETLQAIKELVKNNGLASREHEAS